jgi:hypothetical protein
MLGMCHNHHHNRCSRSGDGARVRFDRSKKQLDLLSQRGIRKNFQRCRGRELVVEPLLCFLRVLQFRRGGGTSSQPGIGTSSRAAGI